MISYEAALKILEKQASLARRPLADRSYTGHDGQFETLPLEQCLGRRLAQEILSPEGIPSFDNSAMDGFALKAEQTQGASSTHPLCFRVEGCIAAGDSASLYAESAVEIMTGAKLPEGGFDAVVKVEDTEVLRDASGRALEIRIFSPLRPGTNVRRKNEDFKSGQKVLGVGDRLSPEHILALSSLGVSECQVFSKIRVALISTGKELVPYTVKHLEPGPKNVMIRNSTAPYLMSALGSYDVEARFFGTIADDPLQFEEVLQKARREGVDLVLTTGAVSMGKYDFVGSVLEKMGAQTFFHKVAIRPGKPLLFAGFPQGPVVFGVPGNPVSTAVGLRFFIAPYLRALLGLEREKPMAATLRARTSKPEGLRCFYKGVLEITPRGVSAQVLSGQASFMVSPLLNTNAWVVLSESGEEVAEGTRVDVFPLHPLPWDWTGSAHAPIRVHDKKGCCT